MKVLELTSENVRAIFEDSLLRKNEIVNGKPIVTPVQAESIGGIIEFHPERLASHKKEISQLVNQLPNIESGPSFLTLAMTKSGEQWGEQPDVAQLVTLGVATGELAYPLPRELWKFLPGDMPLVIKNKTAQSRNPISRDTKVTKR